jgi:hypothetical protein
MNIQHQQFEAEAMPSMEEMRVGYGVHLLLTQIDELIELRHRAETADLMLYEQEALHIANAKLSNLVADLFAASTNGRQ